MALKDLLFHKFNMKTAYKGIVERSKDVKSVSKFVDKLREDPHLTTLLYSFFNGQMFMWVVSQSHLNCVRPWSENESQKY